MNTIEKELQLSIFGERVDRFNPFTHKKTDKEVMESCLSIVEKYGVGFSDWQRELVFTENSDWLKEKTTKELYDLYLEAL
jgi:hypothetical protein